MAGTLAPLTLALAQVDARVGNLDGNVRLVRGHIARARDAGAELVLFPELVLTGYPPEDLLLKEHFLRDAGEALESIAPAATGIVALVGASVVVNASASPYEVGKGERRERMLIQRARDNLCAVAFCNLVGGQDELVFDGHSVVVDHEGQVIARAPQFAEALT